MATEVLSHADIESLSKRRSLLLVWQNPASRRFLKVGQLDVLESGKFAFHYLSDAASDPEFADLDEFPDRYAVYVSDEMPVFFANRIMSAERPSYGQYLNWLGVEALESAELPIEVLARTGGRRVTDTFHIVELPAEGEDSFTSRFFVSGIRHVDDIERAIAGISNGDPLDLRLDPHNAVNPLAVLVDSAAGRKVGYVPDWLCADVHGLIRDGWTVTAVAERVNPDAPAHVRLLCRIEARAR